LNTSRIEEPGGRSLALPEPGFEADLLRAAEGGGAAALLERLFSGVPAGLDAEERQQLATEVLELDLGAGRLLDQLAWLDRFIDLVLSGKSELRFLAPGAADEPEPQGSQ